MKENEIRKYFESDLENGFVYFDKMFDQYVYEYGGDEIMCGKTEEDAFSVYADIMQHDYEQNGINGIQIVEV